MTLRKQQNSDANIDAAWKPESVNEESRTVDLTWTTGADVLRYDMWTGEEYVERLLVSDDAVDLARLRSGAMLLDSHDRSSVRNTLGVVEDAWIDEDGTGGARVRFSERADDVFRDVASGIVRKVSVGYTQNERKITEHEGQPNLHEITRWSPFELSFVTVPADDGAQVRSHKQEHVMLKETEKQTGDPTVETKESPTVTQRAEVTPIDTAKVAREAIEAERSRVRWIEDKCRVHDLPEDFRKELIDDGATIAQCKDRVLEALIAAPGHEEIDSRFAPGDGAREVDYAGALGRALFVKVDPSTGKDLDDDARAFAHLRYSDIALLAMEADGNTAARNQSPSRLADTIIQHLNQRASITTSVLTSVNANISSRSLLMGYDAVPRTFLPIFRQTNVTNYRDNERVKLSDAPVLPVVAEDADYVEVQLSDGKETWVIAKYGHIIKLTREMIINDDLNAFARLLQMQGAAAARTENNVVWAILTTNGALSDTVDIFGAGTNTSSAAAAGIDATTFYAARTAMAGQTSEQGQVLGIDPTYVVFDPANRVAVEELVRPPGPFSTATIGNVLVESYANGLTLVMEPQVGAGNVYFIANNALIDTVEYGWLEGNVGANVATDTVFESDAVRYRVRDEFGAGAVDRRGLYRLLV